MLKKGRLALGSTLLMLLGILVAACGGGGGTTSNQQNNQNQTYKYQEPTHKGGTILYSDWEFPESTNPWFNTSVVGVELAQALYGAPLAVTSDGKFLPDELLEIPTQSNGDVSKDGLTVTLKLRHDLKWSDGQPLTADDFIYWWKTLIDPATGAASTSGFDKDTIADMTAPDSYTVVIKYVKVFAPYLFFLPNAAPKHAWGNIPNKDLLNTQDVNLTPKVTSGPYYVQSYASGQSFTLVPNPYYKSTSLHGPFLDKLVFKGYASKDALIAGYQAGETDHAEDFTIGDLQKLNGLPGLQVSPAISYEHVDPNLQNPALQDLRVRKAIAEGIDRCAIIQGLLHRPCDQLIVNSVEPCPHPDCDPSIKGYSYNPEDAKKQLKDAGYDCSSTPCKKGDLVLKFNLVTTSGNPLRQDTTELIKQQLAKIGIEINLDGQYYPAGTLFGSYSSGGILATGKYDLALFAYVLGLDSDGNLYSSFRSDQIPTDANPAGGNYSRIQDPQLDNLLANGRVTIDIQKRSSIYKQALKIITDQVYSVPLYQRPNITLTDSKVGNYFPNPSSAGNEWNIGEWWNKNATQ